LWRNEIQAKMTRLLLEFFWGARWHHQGGKQTLITTPRIRCARGPERAGALNPKERPQAPAGNAASLAWWGVIAF
jgi:hypothetical protein